MDSKLKALAAEYEKARKQNIQLRTALQAEQEKNKSQAKLINEMKSSANSNSHGDHVSLTRQVESLQSELDIRASSDATRIKDLTDTVSALELENSKLGSDINKLQKAEVFDIAIQTEQAAQSESDVIINLNQMVDYLNQQISQMHLTHETEMSNLMKNKKLVRMESLDLPPELNIIDESDIGFVSDDSSVTNKYDEPISSFFHQRIERLVTELHGANSTSKYYQSEAETCGSRLRLTDEQRLQVIGDLRVEQEKSRKLESELQTTRKGYEDQLNTMTEELAQYLNPVVTETTTQSDKKSNARSRFNLFSRNSN